MSELETALALDPLLAPTTVTLAHVRALQGDAEACDALLDFDKTTMDNYGPFGWRRLRAILYDPRPERLARLREDISRRDFPLRFIVEAGWIVAEERIVPDLLEAAFATMSATSSAPRRTTTWSTIVTDVFAYCGRHDDAIAQLENADRHGLLDLTWLERSPAIEPLRSRPEYRAVLGRVKARALVRTL